MLLVKLILPCTGITSSGKCMKQSSSHRLPKSISYSTNCNASMITTVEWFGMSYTIEYITVVCYFSIQPSLLRLYATL